MQSHHDPSQAACRTARRSHGVAMIEMVLSLPFVMFFLALLFTFGRAYERLEQSLNTVQYAADRATLHAPGPDIPSSMVTAVIPDRDVDLSLWYNQNFPTDAHHYMLNEVSEKSIDAEQYIRALLDRFPQGTTVRLELISPAFNDLDERMIGSTNIEFTRINHEWKHANAVQADDESRIGVIYGAPYTRVMGLLREVFLDELGRAIDPTANGLNPVSNVIQDFYTVPESYRGPTLPPEWFELGDLNWFQEGRGDGRPVF